MKPNVNMLSCVRQESVLRKHEAEAEREGRGKEGGLEPELPRLAVVETGCLRVSQATDKNIALEVMAISHVNPMTQDDELRMYFEGCPMHKSFPDSMRPRDSLPCKL